MTNHQHHHHHHNEEETRSWHSRKMTSAVGGLHLHLTFLLTIIIIFIISNPASMGTTTATAMTYYPKMLANNVTVSKWRRLSDKHRTSQQQQQQPQQESSPYSISFSSPSQQFLVLGTCDEDKPFTFPLSPGEGGGIVCVVLPSQTREQELAHDSSTPLPNLDLKVQAGDGDSVVRFVGDEGLRNCLSVSDGGDGTVGLPFLFHNVPPQGTNVQVTCTEPQDFVIGVVDEAAEDEQVLVESFIEEEDDNDDDNDEGITNSHSKGKAWEVICPTLTDDLAHIKSVQIQAYKSTFANVGQRQVPSHAGVHIIKGRHINHQERGGEDVADVIALEQDDDDNDADQSRSVATTGGDVVLLQYEIETNTGKIYHRTHITSTTEHVGRRRRLGRRRQVQPIWIESTTLTDMGDIQVVLGGVDTDPGQHLLCTLHAGLVLEGGTDETIKQQQQQQEEQHHSLVDVSAMISPENPVLVTHVGWIRKGLASMGLSGRATGWDVEIQDVICEDPNRGYPLTHELVDKHNDGDEEETAGSHGSDGRFRGRRLFQNHHSSALRDEDWQARQLLSQIPTMEEHHVHDDMRVGRRPKFFEEMRNRRLVESGDGADGATPPHELILVHGSCLQNPPTGLWPADQFLGQGYTVKTYEVFGEGYSNDEFAKSIIEEVCDPETGISGSIIGHSQGGTAVLHMVNYYWSCLEHNPHQGYLIQTVGAPFQGSPLVRTMIRVGLLFGIGCGYIHDLSEPGAVTWLDGITEEHQRLVTYYRSQYTDRRFRYDYCNILSDLLVGRPNDGVIQNSRGVLPHGIDGLVKEGYCHASGLRDPSQILDAEQNELMRRASATGSS